jgi:indole-3-glycerol phosphate synthase
MSLLAEIRAQKREEITRLRKQTLPVAPERRPISLRREPGKPLGLMAEMKRRSPSAGPLALRLDVSARARAYEEAGACMLSVLTDQRWFDGDFWDLTLAREGSKLPILCKEFVLDECQLDMARSHGADAVLLIVRFIDDAARLGQLVQAALARDLEPVVEIASLDEARVAVDSGAGHVGVNARDLDDLSLDPERARRALEGLPGSVVRLHFSSLKTPDDVGRVAEGPADAALVGEALMRVDDPRELLSAMVRECGRSPRSG